MINTPLLFSSQMRTESKKSYRSGFLLAEPELRRIIDTLTTQFEKAPCSTVPSTAVEITFRNGSISVTDKLDDVFQLENGGSGTIEKLTIRMKPEDGDLGRCAVGISFAKPNDAENERPIKYVLQGADRDWVFVTSSLLEERLNRVKRANIGRYLSVSFLPLIFMLLWIPFMIMGVWTDQDSEKRERTIIADSINAEWRRGEFKDPIQALVRIEEIRANTETTTSLRSTFIPLITMGMVLFVLFVIAKARPSHTFYWGEAANTYDRHSRIANFVGVVLILGIVISVIGELVANWFTGG